MNGNQSKVSTPYTVLDEQLSTLQSNVKAVERELKRRPMTDTDYARAIRGLQADYDRQKSSILMSNHHLNSICPICKGIKDK